jgi:hypothetical protein
VESGCDFLGLNGWKRERQVIIVGRGERGVARMMKWIATSDKILRYISAFATATNVVNKRGPWL